MRAFPLLAMIVTAAVSDCATLHTLYNFTGALDAGNPRGPLVAGANGVLYGVAGGGVSGTVYELRPPEGSAGAWTERLLRSFNSFTTGDGPSGLAIGEDGALYGATGEAGSAYQCGNVFHMAPQAGSEFWEVSVLFQGFYVYNGCEVDSGVAIGRDGALYGTTSEGGPQVQQCLGGCGTLFQLRPPQEPGGWTQAVLFKFSGADGQNPEGPLAIGEHGEIFGTTAYGGSAGAGTVYVLRPPEAPGGNWTHTVLHDFTPASGDGLGPFGGVAMGADGKLYGTTIYGGASDLGVVFELDPPLEHGGEWTEKILYSFHGSDGEVPQGGLAIGPDGALYGTTWGGGAGPCPAAYTLGCGTVFMLRPAATGVAWSETVLHSFTFDDGANPDGALVFGAEGVLYGTSLYGGSSSNCSSYQGTGCGTAFSVWGIGN